MFNDLSNKIIEIKIIWKEREKYEQAWKELINDWFEFIWDYKYIKENLIIINWYNESIDKEFYKEINLLDIEEKKEVKRKRKKNNL